MMHELYKYLLEHLRNVPILEVYAKPLAAFTVILVILFFAMLLHFLTRKIILKIIQRIARKTKTDWDDILIRKKVFNGVAHLIQ